MTWINKPIIALTIVFFITLYVVMALSAWQYYLLGIKPQGASLVTQAVNTQRVLNSQNFFLNNVETSCTILIPIVGLFLFFASVINTGQVIGLLSVSVGLNPFIYLAAITIPIGLIEFTAYAVLAAEVTYLTILTIDRAGAKERLIKYSWLTILLWLGLLGVAALIEAVI